jgi:hypothetical protein
MSLDGSYDMILLPPQHSTNDDHRLARRRQTRRRPLPRSEEGHSGLPRHPPRRRRHRRENHGQARGSTLSAVEPERVDGAGTPAGDMSGVSLAPGTTTGVASRQRVNPRRTDDADSLMRDLSGISLAPEMATRFISIATSPPSTDQEVPSVFHLVPFRFSFDPPGNPTSTSASTRTYPDLPEYHMWSTWDLLTIASTSEPAGPEEEDDPNFSTDFSELHDPRAMRDFMSACDHCLSGDSDDGHGLNDEGYDPTRECFHINQEEHDGDNHLGMPRNNDAPAPASRVEIPRELAEARPPAGVRTRSLRNSTRCRPSSTKKWSDLCSSDKTSSKSGQVEPSPEERVIEPGTPSAVLLMMTGQGCPRSSTGPART